MKRILALLMVFALIPVYSVFAIEPGGGERVTLIVEVSGDAVLEAEKAASIGAKNFAATAEAREIEANAKMV